jgi:hypothetical protein
VRSIWKFSAQALVENAEVASAEMMCTVRLLEEEGRTVPTPHR